MHRYKLLALVLIEAIALGGCSFGAAEPPDGATAEPAEATQATGNDSVTITFGAVGFMRHVYEPLIAAFNAQHPGIAVQFVPLDQVYQRGSNDNEIARQIVGRAD